MREVANAKMSLLTRERLFIFGLLGPMYACGNCDRCEDVGSSVDTDAQSECAKREVLACIDGGRYRTQPLEFTNCGMSGRSDVYILKRL